MKLRAHRKFARFRLIGSRSRHVILTVSLTLALAGCGKAPLTAAQLAAAGQIDQNAPIKISESLVIAAPVAKVYALLSDITDWTHWQTDITQVSITPGPVAVGEPFSWTSGGTSIHSVLQLLKPDAQIGWTGTVVNFHAIHIWTLTPLPDGTTRVRVDESLRGWLITFFYSSQQLATSDTRWLQLLKVAAEHSP